MSIHFTVYILRTLVYEYDALLLTQEVIYMMGFGGYYGGGAGYGSWSLFGFLICLVLFTDLVLLGIWLWKQINKK